MSDPALIAQGGDSLREAFGKALSGLADAFPKMVVLDADLAGGTGVHHIRTSHPERLIQFGIAYIFGLLTFWFLEIQGLVILSMALESLLGGQIFPLDLLPAWLFKVSSFLPYFYQMYFPVALITGRITDPAEVGQMLAIQAGWVVIILLAGQVLWRRGLRLHTAVGG